MRLFLLFVCVPLLLSGLTACGIEDDPELDDLLVEFARAEGDETIEADVLERIGKLGRKYPDTVIPDLVERLENERANKHLDVLEFSVDYSASDLNPRERRDHLVGVMDTMRQRREQHFRMQACTFVNQGVDAEGIGRIHVRLPRPIASEEAIERYVNQWITRFTIPGTYALWLVVDPPEDDADPKSLWTGDRASFDAFVAEHTKALEASTGAAGDVLQSGDDTFRLCLLRPEGPGKPIRRIVLLRPKLRRNTFDDRDLEIGGFLDKAQSRNVLTIHVDEKRQDSFRRWCETYAGHQMALLANDKAEFTAPVPPVVDGEVVDPLHLDMGAADDPLSNNWVRALLLSVQGTIRYPIHGEVLPDDPRILETPIARSLVAVGRPAVEPVQALSAEGGGLARRAQWIVRRILVAENQKAE